MTENTTAIAHVAKVLDDGGDHTERVDFLNGYGVSIIRNAFSYGGRDGKFEVAVIDADGNLQYDTPVTGDVLGYLDIPEVVAAMQAVAALPAADSVEAAVNRLARKREKLADAIAEKQLELQELQRDYGDLNREISELKEGL
jgi:hypothetical protein